ncbi:MAG: AmmeMemoRadiSam system radical SAM enzyme [Candidatus Omnitrophota bacterium]
MLKKAMLWEERDQNKVHCYLCSHQCIIAEGKFGFCGVRQNQKGELFTHVYAKVIAKHVDPIEKKPFYHFLPGSTAYSIATIGCNFRCSFCQNWTISQVSSENRDAQGYELKPEEVVSEAHKSGCQSISFTYTEPTVFFEYAYDTAKIAKEKGLYTNFVTNGYMTKQALDKIRPYLAAANIDLKFFRDESYQKICKARLEPVLNSIREMKKQGIWLEVTTLIVPGENDSDKELNDIALFLADVDKNIPWHISRFHPDYKYMESYPTPLETMDRAMEIGRKNGLKYVYPGNVSADVHTSCPMCGEILIKRSGFGAEVIRDFFSQGKCVACGEEIEGVWGGK